MDSAELQADAKIAGAIIAAIWDSLPPEQQRVIREFAIRTGKRIAAVAVRAILAYGSQRLSASGVGPLDLEALYASPEFPNPMPQGPPPGDGG